MGALNRFLELQSNLEVSNLGLSAYYVLLHNPHSTVNMVREGELGYNTLFESSQDQASCSSPRNKYIRPL